MQGLQESAKTSSAAIKPSTTVAASKAFNEFWQWFAAREAFLGRDVWHATPQDIAVYMETYWLQHHGELLLLDGHLHASPSYVRSTISHLSSIYKKANQDKAWDLHSQVS